MYLDDILFATHSSQLNYNLTTFNSFHSELQFTLETSVNNSINFLDIKIILDDHRIIFDLYKKFPQGDILIFTHIIPRHIKEVLFLA